MSSASGFSVIIPTSWGIAALAVVVVVAAVFLVAHFLRK